MKIIIKLGIIWAMTISFTQTVSAQNIKKACECGKVFDTNGKVLGVVSDDLQ